MHCRSWQPLVATSLVDPICPPRPQAAQQTFGTLTLPRQWLRHAELSYTRSAPTRLDFRMKEHRIARFPFLANKSGIARWQE
jgi:hypothetical protein